MWDAEAWGMITAAITPLPSLWRRRAGVGAAAALGIVAIAGGMSAGLQSSSRWTNEASAAVIPEVLYLEAEDAKIKTIARVNGDIAREVTVDVGVEALTRPRQAPGDADTAPTLMGGGSDGQAEHGKPDAADAAASDAHASASGNGADNGNATEGGARDNANGSSDGGAGTTDPGTPATPGTGRVDEPVADPAPADDPTPTTTPSRGGGPQNDKDRTTDGKGGKPTVDAKSGSTDTTRTEVNP